MARQERSAGVIVFRPADDDANDNQPLYLLLDYGRHWDYPKGHLEKGEDDLAAAWRELEEETGITDATRVGDFSHDLTYFFRGKGGLIRKTVRFFLARTARKRVTLSHEHAGYKFLPYDEAIDRVTFKSSKDVLRAAHAYLQSHPHLLPTTPTT
jgi:8-oxo-dGTP pyrophosphatase MutT (NUDIX family)